MSHHQQEHKHGEDASAADVKRLREHKKMKLSHRQQEQEGDPEKRFSHLLNDKWNYDGDADDAVRGLLIEHPELAGTKYDFDGGGFPDRIYLDFDGGGGGASPNKIYPVAQALCCGASFDVIKLLREAFPAAAEGKKYHGTPLHRACYCGASREVIQYLFDAYPAAIEEKDSFGRYPLHCASWSDGASPQVVRFLYTAYQAAIREKDRTMSYPLHMACHCGASLEVVQFLYDAYPEAVEKRDNRNQRYPLHCAVGPVGASPEVVRFLYEVYPTAAKEKDRNQMYPLHHACGGSSLEVVRFLYDAYPEAIKENDVEGMTPLHSACEVLQASLQVVQFLLEADPNAVQKKDNFGGTPLGMIGEFQPTIRRCLEITHSFVNLDNPTDEELCDIFNDFHSMAWWGGVMLVINVYPSVIHKLHFDLLFMPDIFAKIGSASNVGAFFEVMKGIPDMMKGVS